MRNERGMEIKEVWEGGVARNSAKRALGMLGRGVIAKGAFCFCFVAFLFLQLATKNAARSPPHPLPPRTDPPRLSDHHAHICLPISASPLASSGRKRGV